MSQYTPRKILREAGNGADDTVYKATDDDDDDKTEQLNQANIERDPERSRSDGSVANLYTMMREGLIAMLVQWREEDSDEVLRG